MTQAIDNLNEKLNGMNSANAASSNQSLLVQNYCNSVLKQPKLDLSGFDNLKEYEANANTGLCNAKNHARAYLEDVQPMIITNITNMSNYYSLQQAISAAIPQGASKQQWLDALNAIYMETVKYQQSADSVVSRLVTLQRNFHIDAEAFNTTVVGMNKVINGNNGIIKSLNDDLDNIQSKIDGAIAGAVLSGLAVVGGSIMIVAGTVSSFLTAGTSAPLAVAGGVVVAAGVGGAVASGIAIDNLSDEKASILKKKYKLQDELKLAQGIDSGFNSLNGQLSHAITATDSMKNAWGLLSGDLGNLADNLNKGIISTDTLRTLFLTAADGQLKVVKHDIDIIKGQMTNIRMIDAPKGETASQAAVRELKAMEVAA
ncbi:HBL/NHE enterotoxin family protein [Photobacterium satsumensis]|uniref:HBL/NHE enterotoxin family protein n=1 Tax=Photobacterium satsumensis TaxID=2910239 RepID=UPI003D100E2F